MLKLNVIPDGAKNYFANTSWLMMEKALRLISGVAVGIWVARYLGPSQFGLLSYSQAIVFFLASIAALGLDNIVVRELIKNKYDPGSVLGTAFILKILSAIFLVIITKILFSKLFTGDPSVDLVFILSLIIIFQSLNVIDFGFQARVLSKYVAFSNCISLAISSITKITLIVVDAPLKLFAIAVLLDAVILAFGLLYWHKRKGLCSLRNWRGDYKVAKRLLSESWPLIFSALLVTVYMKIDQVMVRNMLGNVAAGEYSAAIKLTEVWYIIPVAICSSVFPALVNSKGISESLYRERLTYLYSFLVWTAIIFSILAVLFGKSLILFLYGDDYENAGIVFVIHIWSSVFAFLGIAFGKFLAIEGLTIKSIARTFFGALINVVLNVLLIPIYGLVGAAFATLVAQIASNYLYDFFDIRLRSYIYLKNNAFLLPVSWVLKKIALKLT